jgi:hypothetical protein
MPERVPAPAALFRLGEVRTASGDDVRRQLVLEPGKLVAQQKLALLEPLHLQLVSLSGLSQRLDRCVEIAVLLAQPLDMSDERVTLL